MGDFVTPPGNGRTGRFGRIASRLPTWALLAAAVLAAGCPRPVKKNPDGTVVTVDGDPPDFPGDFTPGEQLPEPPPADPKAFGATYLTRIYEQVRDPWTAFLEDCRLRLPPDHALNSPTLEARFEIVVDLHGQVLDVTRLASSGNDDFDGVADEIARDLGPLPAPPRELLSDDDRAYITWVFARDRRQAGPATAAMRRVELPLEQAVPKYLDDGRLDEAAQRLSRAAAAAASSDPAGPEGTQLLGLTSRLMAAALREGLRSQDPAVQRLAVDAVIASAATETGTASLGPATRELRSIADGSVEVPLRGAATAALAALGDRDAAPMLLKVLERDQGGNPDLSGEAAAALVVFGQGEAAAKLINGWLAGDRARIGGALATLGRAAVPGTVADAAKQIAHKDVGVRAATCTAMGTAIAGKVGGDAGWKAIRKGLDDRDAVVRAACARAAASAAAAGGKSKSSYFRVIELLKDRDDRVRAGALLAALRLEPVKASTELGNLSKEKSPVVLAAFAEGLGGVAGTAPPKRLVELAGNGDVQVRVAAVRALAARSDAASRKVAAGAIVDPELEVRLAAVIAIDDAAELEALAADPAPEVAAVAQARRIERLGRWASLVEATSAVAAAAPESASRVRLAGAWLRAR